MKGKVKARGRFVSKSQWKYFFSSPKLRKYARRWARNTPGGPKIRYRRLPNKKRGR